MQQNVGQQSSKGTLLESTNLLSDPELIKEQTRLWLAVLGLHSSIFSELNRTLSDQAGVSLAKFDTMAQLHRYPDGISMSRLSDALRVSNGNVSGLVNRLIKDNLVCKEMSALDRRSFQAKLTEKGKGKFEQALLVHQKFLSRVFAELSPGELSEINGVLKGLSQKLNLEADDA